MDAHAYHYNGRHPGDQDEHYRVRHNEPRERQGHYFADNDRYNSVHGERYGADAVDDAEQPWGSDKPVYEWQQEYTEASAPSDMKLEEELFGSEKRIVTGIYFDKHNRTHQVRLKGGPSQPVPITNVTES
jgi:hypothetical protein